MYIGHLFRSCGGRATILARAVVSDRHLAGEVAERGDDGDAARRCRFDARPRPCAAFAAAERLRVTVDADGADIARGGFPKWPFLYLTKMKAAPCRATTTAHTRTVARTPLGGAGACIKDIVYGIIYMCVSAVNYAA